MGSLMEGRGQGWATDLGSQRRKRGEQADPTRGFRSEIPPGRAARGTSGCRKQSPLATPPSLCTGGWGRPPPGEVKEPCLGHTWLPHRAWRWVSGALDNMPGAVPWGGAVYPPLLYPVPFTGCPPKNYLLS